MNVTRVHPSTECRTLLMESLATLTSEAEWPSVRAAASRLEQRLAPQVPDPGGSRRLVARVSGVVAAIAPALDDDRLHLLARHALWSIQLDDWLDSPQLHPRELARIPAAVAQVTSGASPPPDAPGVRPLRELSGIVTDLATYDPRGAVRVRYGDALRAAVTAGVGETLLAHAVAGSRRPPPTVEQYLPVATATVNYRSFAYALLAVTVGEVPPERLARLAPALRYAARAVRYSNDLRSVERDRAESGLNVLQLRTAAGRAVTRRWVADEVTRYVQAHDEALTQTTGDDPDGAATAWRRCLDVSVGVYRQTDLR